MSPREFWNLAGRAGRIQHDSVGVVGLAGGKERSKNIDFVRRNTGALASRLVTLLNELSSQGTLNDLESVLWQDQWEDFRCYVAHLWAEKKNLDAVLAESEQLLRQTLGYTTLRNDPTQRNKADALLNATKSYARNLENMQGVPELADSTGFSPEGVKKAMVGMRDLNLENQLTPDDWTPDSLFGKAGRMADLFGVMLKVPQLKQLETVSSNGPDHTHLSQITRGWVNGMRIEDIAKAYFSHDSNQSETDTLTEACKVIYRIIVNNGTWGISALSNLSGMDFDKMAETKRRQINTLPAMIYHGVRTEEAVLMRMNAAPRSAAEELGALYKKVSKGDDEWYSVGKARNFLNEMSLAKWDNVCPKDSALSGGGYRRIWKILSGEGD